MFTKKWKSLPPHTLVEVENSWNMEYSQEKIWVWWNLVHEKQYFHKDTSASQALGRVLEFEHQWEKIIVKIGQAWHFMWIACQIYINDMKVAGNIFCFVPKKKL